MKCDNGYCRRTLTQKNHIKLRLRDDGKKFNPVLCRTCADNFNESVKNTGKAVLLLNGKEWTFRDNKGDINMFSFDAVYKRATSS